MKRQSLDLCGVWRFQPDPGGEGELAEYPSLAHDVRLWREAHVPATFDRCHPGLEAYEGAAWFRRSVAVPADWQDKRVLLRFQGANYHTSAWVNGTNVGSNEDGFLPFEFEVQDQLRYGEENTLVVRVDNQRREGEVPGQQRGWRTYGGILREVELVAADRLSLEYLEVRAFPTDQGGSLQLLGYVHNGSAEDQVAAVTGQVVDSQGRPLAAFRSEPLSIVGGLGQSFELRAEVSGVQPWSPGTPRLYTAQITLDVDTHLADEQEVRFGFRTIETQGPKLLLNGEPIYLTGFNRHEDSPRTGAATDLETARRDLKEIKAAGANFVRLCHYPHHPGELDLCDELGLLAMGEIPLYWWDGKAEGEQGCQNKLESAHRQLATMLRRDVNHPSLIFWSVSNETEENRPEVAAGNRQLVQHAQALDPTRLAVHVSNHWREDPHFVDDDVICVNAYPSLNRRGYGGQVDYDLSLATDIWRDRLAALHARYPDKPILVTEFGYASLQGVYGSGFGEDTQASAIEHEFAGMDAPYVCGATIWCWADHPWPAATFEFCSYLGISPYGVVTRERKKLRAYHTVRRLYRARQGLAEPPRPRVPTPGSDGVQIYMVRPHLRDVPRVPFPEGFAIRPMRPGEGGLWEDIWRDAQEYAPFGPELYESEFSSDRQATAYRSYMVVDDKDVAVGTISAWYHRNYHGRDYGVIHWVAVRPAYQGRGLGRAAISFTLQQLARWHTRAMLNTQTKRLPAIKVYLDFGFRPDLEHAGALEAWREVKTKLNHPGLDEVP